MDDSAVIYGLEDFQARTLVPHVAEVEKINFIVGTQSLRNINQVQLIEFDDDTGLVCKQSFDHEAGEIWCLSSAPQTGDLVATIYCDTKDYQTETGAAVWRLPFNDNSEANDFRKVSVEKKCELVTGENQLWLAWAPEDDSRIATISEEKLATFDIAEGCMQAKETGHATIHSRSSARLAKGRWSGHHGASQVAATHGSGIVAWDVRDMKQAWTIEGAHSPIVRDIDFNPNRQYFLASCGDDGNTRIWDIRNTKECLICRSDHSHWVWSVRFNASYDHLLASCSSDQRVVLASLPSVASKSLGTDEEDEGKESVDSVVSTFEEHEESVYCVEWSTADCWTVASLSYDGRIVFNKVPKSEKYKHFM